MGKHQFSGGYFEVTNEFIIRITFTKDHEVTVDDIKEITKLRKAHFGENRYCSLIDVRHDFLAFSREAKEYIAQNPIINNLRISEALLVRNFRQKLGVSMYIRIFKPKSESKVFENEEKAIKWLTKNYISVMSN